MIRHAKSLIDAAAAGRFATRARLLGYAWLLIGAYAAVAVALVTTGRGNVDLSGRPIGADFGMMWTAGRAALDGPASDVFALASQADLQKRVFGEAAGFTPWLYPPTFLLVAAPLASLPYLAALSLWQGASFTFYLLAIRACIGAKTLLVRPGLLLAAAFPAVFINAAHGQNGFLTASLMTGGVLLLRTHPVAAGALFGLLSYKPQFCLLIPALMLAEARWRAMASALAAACAILALTALLFGGDVFRAFLASLPDAQRLTVEMGATGWEKIQSVSAGVRILGGAYETAMLVQATVAILVVTSVTLVWRSRADMRLKQALVFPGVLLATPYCVDYDMVLLAPGLALLALHGMDRGFARWEISLLTLAFVTPMIARLVAGATHVPLGALVLLGLFAWTLRRALADSRASDAPGLKTSPARPLPSAS